MTDMRATERIDALEEQLADAVRRIGVLEEQLTRAEEVAFDLGRLREQIDTPAYPDPPEPIE